MGILFFILGGILGVVITCIVFRVQTTSGVLKIDHSNPEKDIYRFDITDLDSLSKKTRVILKVDNNASLSQK